MGLWEKIDCIVSYLTDRHWHWMWLHCILSDRYHNDTGHDCIVSYLTGTTLTQTMTALCPVWHVHTDTSHDCILSCLKGTTLTLAMTALCPVWQVPLPAAANADSKGQSGGYNSAASIPAGCRWRASVGGRKGTTSIIHWRWHQPDCCSKPSEETPGKYHLCNSHIEWGKMELK